MGTTAPTVLVFSTENVPCRNRAAFVGFTFLVFSGNARLAFRSDCEFTCDAANCSHNSSKRMSHQKVGISKVAYHRMLVGGLDVVKRAKR